jgi:hypothetical protein
MCLQFLVETETYVFDFKLLLVLAEVIFMLARDAGLCLYAVVAIEEHRQLMPITNYRAKYKTEIDEKISTQSTSRMKFQGSWMTAFMCCPWHASFLVFSGSV